MALRQLSTIPPASGSGSGSGTTSGKNIHVASSQTGVVLDLNFDTGAKIGGGTPTNNDAVLQPLITGGTATAPVKVVIDGPTATNGFTLAPYLEIEGTGPRSGFFALPGANNSVLSNHQAAPFEDFFFGDAVPAQVGYINLRNFAVYGNRGNGTTTGNSTTGDPRGVPDSAHNWVSRGFCGIDLCNLASAVIEDLWIVNTPLYALRINNCSNVTIRNLYVTNPFSGVNCDGIHGSGPLAHVSISAANLSVAGDDMVAVNAPEGYGGNVDGFEVVGGDFTGFSFCRVYAGIYTVRNVRFTGFVARVTHCIAFLGVQAGVAIGNAGTIADNQCEDVTFDGTVTMSLNALVGFILCNSWGSIHTRIRLLNPTQTQGLAGLANTGLTVGEWVMDLTIVRSAAGNSAPYSLIYTTGDVGGGTSCTAHIVRYVIRAFSIVDPPGSSYGNMPQLLSIGTGSVLDELVIENIVPDHLSALVDSTFGWTNIGKVSGRGVATCGFQIPDNKIALNTLYISATGANAGKLCIQHTAGTVIVLG